MARVLVLTGGPDHAHDFHAIGAALTWVVAGGDHEIVEVVDDPNAVVEHLAGGRVDGGVDVLAVNALRWRMLGERFAPWRDRWGYETPEATRAAITRFVTSGGGLLGVHTASICFDDWPAWRDLLGGAWNWERSSHPPDGSVRVEVVEPPRRRGRHPVTASLPQEFWLHDEVYGDLDLHPDLEVLAHARRSLDDDPQPVVWAHRVGHGRVVYDGFGHDPRSINDRHHSRLIRQAVDWVAGGDGR